MRSRSKEQVPNFVRHHIGQECMTKPSPLGKFLNAVIEDICKAPGSLLIRISGTEHIEAKNPYGFIGKYQAQLLDEETVDEACWKVVKQLASRSSIASDVRDGAIQMFGESNSLNASAANARKLKVLEPFSNRQLE